MQASTIMDYDIFSDTCQNGNISDDYSLVKQAWLNEIDAPELLPYCGASVDNLLELVQQQQQFVESMTLNPAKSNPNSIFMSLCHDIECIRYQYVARCYLETRISKIEKFAYYLTFQIDEDTRKALLSDKECIFLKKFITILDKYYLKSIVNKMPHRLVQCENLGTESQRIIDPDMVVFPDIKENVCCFVNETVGPIELNDSTELSINNLSLRQGDIYRLPYHQIRSLLYENKVYLL